MSINAKNKKASKKHYKIKVYNKWTKNDNQSCDIYIHIINILK